MPADTSRTAEVLAVGDVFINRKHPKTAVAMVKDRFDEADLRIGNLEGTLSNEGEEGSMKPDTLNTDPDMMAGIAHAGFDMLGVANNHAMDLGAPALVETVELLDEYDIEHTGGGRNQEEAQRLVHTEANGISVGLLAFEATQVTLDLIAEAQPERGGINMLDVSTLYPEPHVEQYDFERMQMSVREASDEVDILCVMFHFGIGHTRTVPQQALSRAAIDAGADAVLGTHAHVVQGAEVYDSAPILYGLGHFFWDFFFEDKTHLDEHSFTQDTVLASLDITAEGVDRVSLYPTLITADTRQPTLLSADTDAFDRIAEKLITLTEQEGTEIVRDEDCLVIDP